MCVGRILFFSKNPLPSSTLHCNNLFLLQDSILHSGFMWFCEDLAYLLSDLLVMHGSMVFYYICQKTQLIWQAIFLSRIFLYSQKQNNNNKKKTHKKNPTQTPSEIDLSRKPLQTHKQSKKKSFVYVKLLLKHSLQQFGYSALLNCFFVGGKGANSSWAFLNLTWFRSYFGPIFNTKV